MSNSEQRSDQYLGIVNGSIRFWLPAPLGQIGKTGGQNSTRFFMRLICSVQKSETRDKKTNSTLRRNKRNKLRFMLIFFPSFRALVPHQFDSRDIAA